MSEEALQQPQQAEHTELSQPVKVWFDGLPQPLPALAVPSQEGLNLQLGLPHMRRNSEILISFNDSPGLSVSGVLDEVWLDGGQVPQLRARMRTDSTGPYLQVGEEEDEVTLQAEYTREERRTLEVVHIDDVDEVDELQVLENHDDPDAEEDAAVADGLLPLPPEATHTLNEQDETEISVWSLTLPENAREDSGVLSRPQWEARPRQRHLWLWATAVGVTLLALGSMAYTGLFDLVRDQVVSWVSTPSMAVPAPARATDRTAPRAEVPREIAQQSAPPSLAPVKAPASTQPRVLLKGKKATLVIPFKGSSKRADAYPLQGPYALAINLPWAQRMSPESNFRLAKGPFRLVWVRERKGGTHLRVFFRGGQPRHELTIGENEVRISVPTSAN